MSKALPFVFMFVRMILRKEDGKRGGRRREEGGNRMERGWELEGKRREEDDKRIGRGCESGGKRMGRGWEEEWKEEEKEKNRKRGGDLLQGVDQRSRPVQK